MRRILGHGAVQRQSRAGCRRGGGGGPLFRDVLHVFPAVLGVLAIIKHHLHALLGGIRGHALAVGDSPVRGVGVVATSRGWATVGGRLVCSAHRGGGVGVARGSVGPAKRVSVSLVCDSAAG